LSWGLLITLPLHDLAMLTSGLDNNALPPVKAVKLSWIEGVLMNCLLNIWGIMLFLRVTWVIGEAGLVEGLIIITLSNAVTFLTRAQCYKTFFSSVIW
jgi:hypothetical protein